jgi:hypothetical protein
MLRVFVANIIFVRSRMKRLNTHTEYSFTMLLKQTFLAVSTIFLTS